MNKLRELLIYFWGFGVALVFFAIRGLLSVGLFLLIMKLAMLLTDFLTK